jgi:hypothetical protein
VYRSPAALLIDVYQGTLTRVRAQAALFVQKGAASYVESEFGHDRHETIAGVSDLRRGSKPLGGPQVNLDTHILRRRTIGS